MWEADALRVFERDIAWEMTVLEREGALERMGMLG